MKQYIDKRIEKATIAFKDQIIDYAALAAMTECLKIVADEFLEKTTVSVAPDNKKGKCNNGNIRKN